MTPQDALERAINHVYVSSRMFPAIPGYVVQHMNEETRAALRQLRSDDISTVQQPFLSYVVSPSPQSPQGWLDNIRQECLKFDREVLHLD